MIKYILILNGRCVSTTTSLKIANKHFDEYIKRIDPTIDCLQLWSHDEGIVREI